MAMSTNLEGKVVVITGGAMGIGRATAKKACEEGAKVAICDIDEEKGKEAVNELNKLGHTAKFYNMDVSKEGQVKETFSRIKSEMGPIYGLVNNAGIAGVNKQTHEITEEEWDKVIDVNLKGVFLCTKHAVPQMMEAGGGNIVNLSSVYGMVGAADAPPYHATKGAVRLLTKVDAINYANKNIRVNSIHPGIVETPMIMAYAKATEDEKAAIEGLSKRHPMGRIGEPKEIADAILFLLSDKSAFMTGSELVIDGGYTAQ